jgi:hypothetical protein
MCDDQENTQSLTSETTYQDLIDVTPGSAVRCCSAIAVRARLRADFMAYRLTM